MATVVSVVERRAMLKALGPRPGPDAVEKARHAIKKIDEQMDEALEALSNAAAPAGVNAEEWRDAQESDIRETAEKEKFPFKSVIQLDEVHQLYEDELKMEELSLDGRSTPENATERQITEVDEGREEEVARLLQDAMANNRTELDLKSRGMVHVPEFFGRIKTLTVLDLSGNQLASLPDAVAGLENLQVLKLQSNQLKTLPDSLGLLSKLQYLDISANLLKFLPESIGRCSSLTFVDANFNQLEYIPTNFGLLLKSLETLHLHMNNLVGLPSSIGELTALKYLDVHFNKLKGLPSTVGNLRNLEYLDCSSNFNDLCFLPDSIGDLVSLTHLYLSYNQIKELPDSFGRLEKLVDLKMDGNPLLYPPMSVVEKGAKEVVEFMREEVKARIEAAEREAQAVESKDHSTWVPGWVPGGTWVGEWIGSVYTNVGTTLERRMRRWFSRPIASVIFQTETVWPVKVREIIKTLLCHYKVDQPMQDSPEEKRF
ncbi:hypothetical protein R1flu_007769 [Riccia fluitans]|uniref:Uncharacterized protein n=1 Tax=Riccia fluitans TaxID=41844 RepID=A0ABD1YZS6_9MARC